MSSGSSVPVFLLYEAVVLSCVICEQVAEVSDS